MLCLFPAALCLLSRFSTVLTRRMTHLLLICLSACFFLTFPIRHHTAMVTLAQEKLSHSPHKEPASPPRSHLPRQLRAQHHHLYLNKTLEDTVTISKTIANSPTNKLILVSRPSCPGPITHHIRQHKYQSSHFPLKLLQKSSPSIKQLLIHDCHSPPLATRQPSQRTCPPFPFFQL